MRCISMRSAAPVRNDRFQPSPASAYRTKRLVVMAPSTTPIVARSSVASAVSAAADRCSGGSGQEGPESPLGAPPARREEHRDAARGGCPPRPRPCPTDRGGRPASRPESNGQSGPESRNAAPPRSAGCTRCPRFAGRGCRGRENRRSRTTTRQFGNPGRVLLHRRETADVPRGGPCDREWVRTLSNALGLRTGNCAARPLPNRLR